MSSKYVTLNNYEQATLKPEDSGLSMFCPKKSQKVKEEFGTFSISAAVRPPYNTRRSCSQTTLPKINNISGV